MSIVTQGTALLQHAHGGVAHLRVTLNPQCHFQVPTSKHRCKDRKQENGIIGEFLNYWLIRFDLTTIHDSNCILLDSWHHSWHLHCPSCHGVWGDAMVQHLLQQKDGRLPLVGLPDLPRQTWVPSGHDCDVAIEDIRPESSWMFSHEWNMVDLSSSWCGVSLPEGNIGVT